MLLNTLKCEGRAFVKSTILFLLMLSITAIGAVVLSEHMDRIMVRLEDAPSEILALLGMRALHAKDISLTIFYIVSILLNMTAIAKCAATSVEVVKTDEENGTIRFYINQPYSRNQIFMLKTVIAMISAIMQWVMYIVLMLGVVYFICSQRGLLFSLQVEDIIAVGIRGILFVICAVVIALLYSLSEEMTMTYEYFLSILFFYSFIIGNIYKIADVLEAYLGNVQIVELIQKISGYLVNLRILFPFTLLNVFNVGRQPLPDFTYMVYGIISMVLLAVCWYVYTKKDL